MKRWEGIKIMKQNRIECARRNIYIKNRISCVVKWMIVCNFRLMSDIVFIYLFIGYRNIDRLTCIAE